MILKLARRRFGKIMTSGRMTAGKLVADLNEVDRLLAAGYSLDERRPGIAPAARQILEQWQKQDFFGSEAVQSSDCAAVAPINELGKADTAGAGADCRDRASIETGIAADGMAEFGGRAAAWPAEREDLKQAMEMSQSLVEAVGTSCAGGAARASVERVESIDGKSCGIEVFGEGGESGRYRVCAGDEGEAEFRAEISSMAGRGSMRRFMMRGTGMKG
jgi:hypothetical protein